MLGVTVKNLEVWATWRPEFVHPCMEPTSCIQNDSMTERTQRILNKIKMGRTCNYNCN